MRLRSLGLRSDLLFHRIEGEVDDLGDCLRIRTPDNPGYRWGNFLLFPAPPAPGDLARWEARFLEALGTGYRHRVFAWDGVDGDAGAIAPFVEAGYRFGTNEVRIARPGELRPPDPPASGLEIRPLESDADWEAQLELQLYMDTDADPAGYTAFWRAKQVVYRRMQADGRGAWHGGFVDGRLLGSMGLYYAEPADGVGAIGRFQAVGVHPEARRRGIAGTMIHALSEAAFASGRAEALVLMTDPEGPAHALYKRLGYRLRERVCGVEKHPL